MIFSNFTSLRLLARHGHAGCDLSPVNVYLDPFFHDRKQARRGDPLGSFAASGRLTPDLT
jgi:hypothetical protein